MPAFSSTSLASLTYPRTGKRGVPQQFPRRLHEMLESEAMLEQTSPEHRKIIAWSDSGKAFRILDASLFASHILPKYFRTSKFSSFQRNLNLYGFAKVRRGPDTDMYAHPSFVRGQPETLSQLRKCNSAAARKRLVTCLDTSDDGSCGYSSTKSEKAQARSVSPSPPKTISQPLLPSFVNKKRMEGANGIESFMSPVWSQTHAVNVPFGRERCVPPREKGSSRLNLLAMAMTSMAERDYFVESAGARLHCA